MELLKEGYISSATVMMPCVGWEAVNSVGTILKSM